MKAEAVVVCDTHSRLSHKSPAEHSKVHIQPPPPGVTKSLELHHRSKCACDLGSLVRELLHPLLQEWLDRNLPQIVEKCVNDEIKRMART